MATGFRDTLTGTLWSGDLVRALSTRDDDSSNNNEMPRFMRAVTNVVNDVEIELARHGTEAKLIEERLQQDDTWHLRTLRGLERELAANFFEGLTQTKVQELLQEHGPNELEVERPPSLIFLYVLQFVNILIVLLVAASISSICLGEWVEGIAILIMININAAISLYSERSTTKALENLARLSQASASVIRGGIQVEVPSRDIVPGDTILLRTGDVIPADVRLTESTDLRVNESLLTGESEDVAKDAKADLSSTEHAHKLTSANMCFASTAVTAGHGKGVVIATGMQTRIGNIARLLKSSSSDADIPRPRSNSSFTTFRIPKMVKITAPRRTPLQRSLHGFGIKIGFSALVVCAIMFVVGVVRNEADPDHHDVPVALQVLTLTVSLAVSAIPEGLPLCVSICIAMGTHMMVRHKVLVRKLPAVETLGAASVICTDKTGTLTEGKMTVSKVYTGSRVYDISGRGLDPRGEIHYEGHNILSQSSMDHAALYTTLLAACLCSNTEIRNEEGGWKSFGNSTEAALVVAAAKLKIMREAVVQAYPKRYEVPFSSNRKMMATMHGVKSDIDGLRFGKIRIQQGCKLVSCVKGAPDYLLSRCTHAMAPDGSTYALKDAERQLIMEEVDLLSSQTLRVLAVAYKEMTDVPFEQTDDVESKFNSLANNVTFLGLVACADPERDGVKQSIMKARAAGIRTVMITGDYLKTAVSLARNIDLLPVGQDASGLALDCRELRPHGEYLPDYEFDERACYAVLYARAEPQDKLEIVKSLKRQGFCCAMTGDGVNDAPAIKEADIGIAMGVTGTEVAKGASDMILLDDHFNNIVTAVEKGRVIYSNIQKFVCYLISTSWVQIIVTFVCIAIGLPAPLYPLQILFIHLSKPALALTAEPGDSNIMDKKPRPTGRAVIHGSKLAAIVTHTVALTAAMFVTFVLGLYLSTGKVLLQDIVTKIDGLYVCDVYQIEGTWVRVRNTSCVIEGLNTARTMAFICVSFAELLRAFTIRSFQLPFYDRFFANRPMCAGVLVSLGLTLLLLFLPDARYVFKLTNLNWHMWLIAVSGALFTACFDETIKMKLRQRFRSSKNWQAVHEGFQLMLTEMKGLRIHMLELEKRLEHEKRQARKDRVKVV